MKANEIRIGNYVEIDQYPNDRVTIQKYYTHIQKNKK